MPKRNILIFKWNCERSLFIKVGYDVGICEDECIFSSIINEIIFGHIEELIAFKESLNENLLFPDKKSAEEYVCMHNQMEALGKDVEDHLSMHVHEIWMHSPS